MKKKLLSVEMNGDPVGTLEVQRGQFRFQYDTRWLARQTATPLSLSLPLSREPHVGETVLNYFDNLLPDSRDIRERMQRALGTRSAGTFDLLSGAGRDCVGAVRLTDASAPPFDRAVEAVRVSDAEIARTLRGHRLEPLGMAPERDDFRISIAGAQEKTAFLHHRGVWKRPLGSTPTSHIFKLPMGEVPWAGYRPSLHDSVENEWLCLRIVHAFGLPVCNADIWTHEKDKALVVERFDRKWAARKKWLIRLPQEDFCQALGVSPALKYESAGGPGIRDVMELLGAGIPEDREVFFKANIVYWLLAAIDGHAKNFSLFLHPGGRFRLTPLYDVISAYPLLARKELPKQELRMGMGVHGKNKHYRWSEIRKQHWLATAKASYFSPGRAEELLSECVSQIDSVIARVKNELPKRFPKSVSAPIFAGLRGMRRA